MKLLSRAAAVCTGLMLSIGGAIAMAAPAAAAYANESHVEWTPPGPVHAIVTSGTQTYLGGANAGDTGGFIAAVNSSTGANIWTKNTDGDVRALAMSTDGSKLLAGGAFVNIEGATHRRLASLDAVSGMADPVTGTDGWKGSAGGTVRDLVVDGNNLYVGGTFGSLNGNGQRGLGKLSVDEGRLVAGFSAFTDAPVYGLARSGSTLVAAGKFTTVNNQARASLASVDLVTGALSPWAPARMCTNCATYWDITVSGNTVYVASSGPGGQVGAYDLATGAPRWRYVHTDGDVQAVTVSDGLLYIGGHFNQYVGSNTPANERHQLAALNPATGALDPGFAPRMHNSYPGVWALAATASRLYVGGHFGGVGSPTSNREPYFAMFGAI